MRLRPVWLVVVALMLPATAHAHGHTWDGSGGPTSSGGGSLLVGVYFGIGITLRDMVDNDLSIIGDVANLKGKHDNQELTQLSYMGGLRWAVNGGDENRKNLLMVHGLIGILNRHQGNDDRTHFAGSVGASYEFIPLAGLAGWAVRGQIDRQFVNNIKDFWRVSGGVVRRFN